MSKPDFSQALAETVKHIQKQHLKYTAEHTASSLVMHEQLHLTKRCVATCPFCRVDQDAENYLMRLMNGELQ